MKHIQCFSLPAHTFMRETITEGRVEGRGGGGTIISATVTSHLLIEYPIWIPGREKWTCESSYLKISSTGYRMPSVTSHLLIKYPIWIPGMEKWTCESSYLKISSTGCRMPSVTSHLLIKYPIWIPGMEKWTCESSYLKISSTGCRMPVSLLASMMLHTKRCAQMPRKYLTHFCSQGNTGPDLINPAKNAAKANWWILHTVVFGPHNENSNSYCGAHRPNNLFSIYRYRIS